MTQRYAVAQYVGSRPNPGQQQPPQQPPPPPQPSQINEPDIFVPATAVAAPPTPATHYSDPMHLPPFGASPAPLYATATATATVPAAAGFAATPLATATPVKSGKFDTTTPPPATTTTTTVTHIPPPSDHLPYAAEQRLAAMKFHRKHRQAAAATTGAIVGLLFLGPIGAAVGGFASHQIVKHSGRAQESRVRKHFKQQVNQQQQHHHHHGRGAQRRNSMP